MWAPRRVRRDRRSTETTRAPIGALRIGYASRHHGFGLTPPGVDWIEQGTATKRDVFKWMRMSLDLWGFFDALRSPFHALSSPLLDLRAPFNDLMKKSLR